MNSSTIPIRISCAGLIKIVLQEDRFLGTINENSLRQGRFVYTPPGGSFHYFGKTTRDYLEKELGLIFQENKKDLRLLLPETVERRRVALESFATWFSRRKRREITPSRELYEELIDEQQVLSLQRHGFPKLHFIGTARIQLQTSRGGQKGELTEYFWEIFEAQLTHVSRRLLERGIKQKYPFVHLLTREEIARGITDREIRCGDYKGHIAIAPSFNYLIASKPF
ncbi:MAG: hypothetical protein Q8L34_03210 [Candidatus Woesearchaeota archaeon]|nr:hypothetical protein [Candidatus Woesearchaeota archaeon]